MIQKVSYLGEGLYQLDNDSIPLDEETLKRVVAEIHSDWGVTSLESWLKELKEKKESSLNVQSSKGVVVNLYEVDYPPPKDPRKETQQVAQYVDEPRDFITQYIFPSSTSEDVLIGLRSDILADEEKLYKENIPDRETRESSWRDIL